MEIECKYESELLQELTKMGKQSNLGGGEWGENETERKATEITCTTTARI